MWLTKSGPKVGTGYLIWLAWWGLCAWCSGCQSDCPGRTSSFPSREASAIRLITGGSGRRRNLREMDAAALWSAATCRRFSPAGHVPPFQSAYVSAHSMWLRGFPARPSAVGRGTGGSSSPPPAGLASCPQQASSVPLPQSSVAGRCISGVGRAFSGPEGVSAAFPGVCTAVLRSCNAVLRSCNAVLRHRRTILRRRNVVLGSRKIILRRRSGVLPSCKTVLRRRKTAVGSRKMVPRERKTVLHDGKMVLCEGKTG